MANKTDMMFLLTCFFGFVGLVSFGLIPARSWQVFKNALHWNLRGKVKIAAIIFLSIPSIFGILHEVEVALGMFNCILWSGCGPNRGHRWLLLASLGFTYIGIELLFLIIKFIIVKFHEK